MKETTGERIRMLRDRAKLSQTELGAKVKLSFNSICAMEKGRVDPKASRSGRLLACWGCQQIICCAWISKTKKGKTPRSPLLRPWLAPNRSSSIETLRCR